jgi:hypothetical protein
VLLGVVPQPVIAIIQPSVERMLALAGATITVAVH